MTNAVIYTRFSPRRNAGASESCETQLAYCEQHAHKHGYVIARVFHDKDVSGKDEYREKLWKAIESLDKGGVLLVFKRDRLARNVYLSEQINRMVEKNGARIEAVTGDVAGDSDEAVMIRQMLSVVHEYERKMIAKRTQYAMRFLQSKGRRMGRYAPYGWATDPAGGPNMVEVPAEQAAVNRIKELRASHSMLPAQIVKAMNEEMPEAARTGKWNQKTISKILNRGLSNEVT